jgi:uncharacterized protein RhaS with RHS repeats
VSTFRARQYDPGTGKWLQEDPTGLAGGANLYEYNGNDPNTFSDPFGLDCPDKNDPACTMGAQIAASISAGIHSAVTAIGNVGRAVESGIKSVSSAAAVQLGLAAVTEGASGAVEGVAAAAEAAPSAGMIRQFAGQLAEQGSASVERSMQSLESRLAEHMTKLNEIEKAGGHASSVRREISNFQRQIQAAKQVLGGGQQ